MSMCSGFDCSDCMHYSKLFGICLIEIEWEVWEELRRRRRMRT